MDQPVGRACGQEHREEVSYERIHTFLLPTALLSLEIPRTDRFLNHREDKKIFAAHNNPFQKAHAENEEDGVTLSLNGSSLLLLANPE